MTLRLLLAGCAMTLAPWATASAEQTNYWASIGLHIDDVVTKNVCEPSITSSTVRSYTPNLSTPTGPFYYVYLFACNASESLGVAGMEFGITYPGMADDLIRDEVVVQLDLNAPVAK